MTSWFVLFPAEDNKATKESTKVAISDIGLWVLYADENIPNDITKSQWRKMSVPTKPTWAANYDFDLINYLSNSPELSVDDYERVYQLD